MVITKAIQVFRVRVHNYGTLVPTDGTVDFTWTATGAYPLYGGQVVDVLTGQYNTSPWQLEVTNVTSQFISNMASGGRMQLVARLVEVQESRDGGAYATVMTGRLSRVMQRSDISSFDIQISDERWMEADATVFNATDTVQLIPPKAIGSPKGFWSTDGQRRIATVRDAVAGFEFTNDANRSGIQLIGSGGNVYSAIAGVIEDDLVDNPNVLRTDGQGNFKHTRIYVDGVEYPILAFNHKFISQLTTDSDPIEDLRLHEGTNWGVSVLFWVGGILPIPRAGFRSHYEVLVKAPTMEPSNVTPLHVGISDGGLSKYGLDYSIGQNVWNIVTKIYDELGIRYDQTAFNNLAVAMPYRWEWRITSVPDNARSWLDTHVYGPLMVAPFIDNQGRISPRSIRIPSEDGTLDPDAFLTLSTAFEFNKGNLIGAPSWEFAEDIVSIVRAEYNVIRADFEEISWSRDGTVRNTTVASADVNAADMLTADTKTFVEYTSSNQANVGDKIAAFDFNGAYRVNQRRMNDGAYAENALGSVARDSEFMSFQVFDRFGDGSLTGRFDSMKLHPDGSARTPLDDVSPGQFVKLNIGTWPNPLTPAYGGTRIVQLLSKSVKSDRITWEYLDAGPSIAPLAVPTIAVVLTTGNTAHSVDIALSNIPAGATADVRFRLGANGFNWTISDKANSTFTVPGLPANTVVGVRCQARQVGKLKSDWSAEQTVTAAALTAPTIGATTVDGLNIKLAWTVAAGRYSLRPMFRKSSEDIYAFSNQDATQALGNGTIVAVGQSFTGQGEFLGKCRVDLSKTLTPTGNLVAKVYAHGGTFGTSSVPTGAALATSANFDVSTLTGTITEKDIVFTDDFLLVLGTKYFLELEYSGGNATNFVNVGTDASSPSHAGNFATSSGSYTADATRDMTFSVTSIFRGATQLPLPATSSFFVFPLTLESTSYDFGVKHVDEFGGESALVTATATTGTARVAAAPKEFRLLQARGSGTELPPDDQVIGYGFEVGWTVGDLQTETQLQLSTTNVFTVIDLDIFFPVGTDRGIVPLDILDETTRYMRIRHARADIGDSPFSSTISAKPTALTNRQGADTFAGGFANIGIAANGEIEITVGHGDDPDTDKAYVECVVNPVSSSAYPTVDETDQEILRSAMTFVGPTNTGGPNLTAVFGDLVLGTVRFFNDVSGFGQQVQMRLIVGSEHVVSADPDLDEDNGVWNLRPGRSGGAKSVKYFVTFDGDDPTLLEVQGGTVSTADEILNVRTSVLDGERVKAGVLPYSDAAATLNEGTLVIRRGVYRAGNDIPTVTWRKTTPTDRTKEAVRFSTSDDSDSVAFWYQIYDEGLSPAAWLNTSHRHTNDDGTPDPTGYASDPLIVTVEETKPIEGGTRRVIRYRGEDATGLFSDEKTVLIDGDAIPSGTMVGSTDSDGATKVAVNSTDPDSGSWRIRAAKTAYQDPDGDIGAPPVAEFSGIAFPVDVALGTDWRDEDIYCTGYFYRVASAAWSAQDNGTGLSTKSEKIRFKIAKRPDTTEVGNYVRGNLYFAPGATPNKWQIHGDIETGKLTTSIKTTHTDNAGTPGIVGETFTVIEGDRPIQHIVIKTTGAVPLEYDTSDINLLETVLTPNDGTSDGTAVEYHMSDPQSAPTGSGRYEDQAGTVFLSERVVAKSGAGVEVTVVANVANLEVKEADFSTVVKTISPGELIDVTGTVSVPIVSVDLSELVPMLGTDVVKATDWMVVLDATASPQHRKIQFDEIRLSDLNDDIGAAGVTAVTVGTGLLDTGTATAPNITLDFPALPVAGVLDGADELVVMEAGVESREPFNTVSLDIFQSGSLTNVSVSTSAAIAVSKLAAGTFAAGNYVFPADLHVTDQLGVGVAAGADRIAVTETGLSVRLGLLTHSHATPLGLDLFFSNVTPPDNRTAYGFQVRDSVIVRSALWSDGGATWQGNHDGPGLWQAGTVASDFGGTGLKNASITAGGLLRSLDGTSWGNLPVGAADTVLTISGGFPTWVLPTVGDITAVNITAGIGLLGDKNTASGDHTQTIDFDATSLPPLASGLATADHIIVSDALVSKKALISGINLSIFNKDLTHAQLQSVVADQHVAHTGVSISAGTGLTGGGAIDVSRTVNLAVDTLAEKTGALVAADRLTGTSGATNFSETISAIPLSIFSKDLAHSDLTGIVAEEHILHSGVTLTAGVGLTGGGTISASRTFTVALSQLPDNTAALINSDELIVLDAGVQGRKSLIEIGLDLFDNTTSGFTSNTGTVTGVTAGVGLDSSGGTTPNITLAVIEVVEKTGALAGTDRLLGDTVGVNFCETISGIPLGVFNNDQGWTNNTGTVTSVSGGTNINTSGSTAVTVNLDASISLTEVTVTSDMRLKRVVADLDKVKALAAICQMHAFYYHWKDEEQGKERRIGLSAQQLQGLVPEVVNEKDDDIGTLGVACGQMTPMLIAAVQGLAERVEALEA